MFLRIRFGVMDDIFGHDNARIDQHSDGNRNSLRDVVIKGAPTERIVEVLRHDELYPHPETLVTFSKHQRSVGSESFSAIEVRL
jgi:hypothetical protein